MSHTHLVQSYNVTKAGGLISASSELVKHQIASGINSTLITTCEDNEVIRESFVQAVPRTKIFGRFFYSPQLKKTIQKSLYKDFLHLHGLYTYPSLCFNQVASEFHKSIIHVHGMFEPWILRHSILKKYIAGLLYENSKKRQHYCWRALTKIEALQIRHFGAAGKIEVIPNGIDVSQFRVERKNSITNKKVVLFLGRLHEKKGLVPLVHAWSRLDAKILSDWTLKVVGPDDGLLEFLQKFILSNRLGHTISILPPVFGEEKVRTLAEADAFILPSFSEGFSVAILEAMASGLPCLITPECNFMEAFDFGAIKISNEEAALKLGLTEFLQLDQATRVSLGQSSRSFVSKTYDWEVIVRSLEEAF